MATTSRAAALTAPAYDDGRIGPPCGSVGDALQPFATGAETGHGGREPGTAFMSGPGVIRRDMVVIGTSAGGVEALIGLFGKLPTHLPAAVAVVIHRNPRRPSQLAEVLDRHATLPVSEPGDGEAIQFGHIYLGRQDYHLLIEGTRFRLDAGPKQHRTRPAIDPLFESAAQAFGPRVVGVLLSGGGSDGVSGLIAISRAGGKSLAQDPTEAKNPSMPTRAICEDDVDAVLPLEKLADAITALATEGTIENRGSQQERHAAPRE
jgi:two-component system, chemotaxis family, protein-glutamate methylesterase/glutaminase